jgi:2-polyprenyl-3-methyl-5-hydroxy-6-metoxy-1,4-benzoquinol methylase
MRIIGGQLDYALMRFITARKYTTTQEACQVEADTNLEQAFGKGFFSLINAKTVIDFGCGLGNQSMEIARRGAIKVIGIDIQEHYLEHGRQKARQLDVSERCIFTTATAEAADIVISKDAFEHFSDPVAMLEIIATLLKPGGFVLASFGPT